MTQTVIGATDYLQSKNNLQSFDVLTFLTPTISKKIHLTLSVCACVLSLAALGQRAHSQLQTILMPKGPFA
jgi:hypothetical protein